MWYNYSMTVNSEIIPIFQGQPVKSGDYSLTPQILTLDGDANVLISAPNGEAITIPAHFLEALSNRASHVRSSISKETDMLRRTFHGDLTSYGISPLQSSPLQYVLNGARYAQDGTPVLLWSGDRNFEHEKTGWKLSLSGTKDAYIGFARWDDKEAFLNLISQMHNVDSLFAVSGIMYPETTGKLAARMAAARMRTARELPGIDLKKARQILTNAGLTSENTSMRYYAARIRLLKISSGGKDVPIAVAVVAPHPSQELLKLTDEEKALPYHQRNEIISERTAAIRKPWQDKAAAAFLAAGWRIVSLPEPYGSWSGKVPATWATRIDSDTWSTIKAAAEVAAGELQMSRGGVI